MYITMDTLKHTSRRVEDHFSKAEKPKNLKDQGSLSSGKIFFCTKGLLVDHKTLLIAGNFIAKSLSRLLRFTQA